MGRKKKKVEVTGKMIEAEYMIHNEYEDDEMYWVKEALSNVLTPYQRKIYLTYLEAGSYTGAARAFNVSVPTAKKYIVKLTQTIMNYVCNKLK